MLPRSCQTRHASSVVVLLLVLTAVQFAVEAQDAAVTTNTDRLDALRRRQIEAWIVQLDDDRYDVREAASRHLANAGEEAIPLLEPLVRHPSPEVRFRAQAVLRSLAQLPLSRLRQEMEAFCALPEERFDVERGLCLIARLMDRSVVEHELVRQLDELAGKVTARLAADPEPERMSPQRAVAALQEVLFQDFGLQGNEDDYDNPHNCSLAFVLRERKGKPILLAEIMVAVAKRAKIPLVGIPGAGRYIARYDGARAPAGHRRDDIYLDPFGGGVILSREDRQRLFPGDDPDALAPPATNLTIITRTLRNITADYQSRGPAADPDGQELVAQMLELLQSRAPAP